ncbi:MAG: D-alanine--D-alanine ligase [Bacteroidales bacterium]|nr:D-alanine--D-alanine ligase [Bacteroidales bacterium]
MRTIAIVGGGDSSEFEISVKSAEAVLGSLSGIYNSYLIIIKGTDWYWEGSKGMALPVDKNRFTLKLPDKIVRFDAVFIAIHGTPGENGLLQGYYDIIGIPYTSCNAFCSSLTFNKNACKIFLKEFNILMAESILIKKGDEYDINEIAGKIGLPCFVKPNDSGSSFGVSRVEQVSKMADAINEAFSESCGVLVESLLEGIEVGCGVVKTSAKEVVLPVTEIVSKNKFFDYEAKYTPGGADEITPARIPDDVYALVQSLSSEIYDHIGCNGIVRVDFIIVDNKPFFLEINSVPGLTAESIIPKQIAASGMKAADLYSMVIEDLF